MGHIITMASCSRICWLAQPDYHEYEVLNVHVPVRLLLQWWLQEPDQLRSHKTKRKKASYRCERCALQTITEQYRPLSCTMKIMLPKRSQTNGLERHNPTKQSRRRIERQDVRRTKWRWACIERSVCTMYSSTTNRMTTDRKQETKRAAKKVVATARIAHQEDVSKNLDVRDASSGNWRCLDGGMQKTLKVLCKSTTETIISLWTATKWCWGGAAFSFLN